MTLRDALRLAASGLRGGIVRTLLTILGLGVGVGAVLAVITLGDAGQSRVEAEIARMGVDKVWIRARDDRHHLASTDAERMYQATDAPACAGAYTVAAVGVQGRQQLTQIAGFDASMQAVHGLKVLQGREFTAADEAAGYAVCLVDQAFADQLEESAVGQRITIGQRRFRIIGVVKGMTMQTMAAGSGLVILPLRLFQATLGGQIAEITLLVQPGQQTEEIARLALAELSAEGFRADTLEKEIDAAREIVRIFVMVLICVAIVCMITGSIGVMNVLLVSVRERRREIGLLKAVGGTSAQVGLLFLLEAAAYSILGGMLGIALGAAMTQSFGSWIGLSPNMQPGTVAGVLAASAAMGVVFGVAPALKASGLSPVDALHCD